MLIDILTVATQMVETALPHSILGRAIDSGIVRIQVHDLHDYAADRHRTTDSPPCGGGGGMVLKPEPIERAIAHASRLSQPDRIILTDPQGVRFDQEAAFEMACLDHLVFICGRYEGVDERVRWTLASHAYSIGDYVLTGGEPAAWVMVDAIVRLLPGALGCADAPSRDSFADGLLDYPQFTRPRSFRGVGVPDALLDGGHREVESWRRLQQLRRTRALRPDLWARCDITADDVHLLESTAAHRCPQRYTEKEYAGARS